MRVITETESDEDIYMGAGMSRGAPQEFEWEPCRYTTSASASALVQTMSASIRVSHQVVYVVSSAVCPCFFVSSIVCLATPVRLCLLYIGIVPVDITYIPHTTQTGYNRFFERACTPRKKCYCGLAIENRRRRRRVTKALC
jgi:hypothetical protein